MKIKKIYENEEQKQKNTLNEFERLWKIYMEKLQRYDDLVNQGRFGYQLRMPGKAIQIAKKNLDDFCIANNIEITW